MANPVFLYCTGQLLIKKNLANELSALGNLSTYTFKTCSPPQQHNSQNDDQAALKHRQQRHRQDHSGKNTEYKGQYTQPQRITPAPRRPSAHYLASLTSLHSTHQSAFVLPNEPLCLERLWRHIKINHYFIHFALKFTLQ